MFLKPEKRRQPSMPQNTFFMQPFEAKRVRFESTRSFDEVLLNLRKVVGTATPQKVITQEAGGGSREQFEKAIQSQVEESDFMLFFRDRPRGLAAALWY